MVSKKDESPATRRLFWGQALAFACLTFCTSSAHGDEPATKQPSASVEQSQQKRTDLYGDPLPKGVVARLGTMQLRHAGLSELVFLADGKTLVSGGSDGVVRIWDVGAGRLRRAVRLQGKAGWPALSRDGKLAAAPVDGMLVIWDATSGKEIKRFAGVPIPPPVGSGGHSSYAAHWYFTPDAKTVLVASWDSKFTFWDRATANKRTLQLPVRKIGMDSTFHSCISPDGKWLVAAADLANPCVFWTWAVVAKHTVSTATLLPRLSPQTVNAWPFAA